MTLKDRLREELEERADEIVAAYVAGLESDDPRIRLQAAEAWLSRVHGRPTERVETEDKGVDLRSRTREELEPSWSV
jgi:hypothetical protein